MCEDDEVMSDQNQVCNICNDYFVKIAKDLTTDVHFQIHPSVLSITENHQSRDINSFEFTHVSSESIFELSSNCKIKKATGIDGISAQILKRCKKSFCNTLSDLINNFFFQKCFSK